LGFLGRYRPKAPKPRTPKPLSLDLCLENFHKTNLRSSSRIFSAFFLHPWPIFGVRRKSFLHFSILPSSTFRGSLGIFPSFFHQPQPTSGVRRKSFQHFSIYPGRLPEFVANLFSNFPSSLPDIQSSPKKFSAFFQSTPPDL